MPRKPKVEKQQITVVVNNQPVSVILHPPNGTRSSWYAYWNGLVTSRSTGKSDLQEAIRVVEGMLRNGGKRSTLAETVLSDEEFEQIQRVHFGRKSDAAAQVRAAKSLHCCLEAISAFKLITGLERIAAATPDDCARFQREAIKKPKSWRLPYPNRRVKDVDCLSPTTVDKWSRALQAAFERANINAGRKCVRGVVAEAKLIESNPWMQFTWIEKRERPIRHFTHEELLSVLDYFETKWKEVRIAASAVKLCLWTWTRVAELASLRWDDLRSVSQEYHFRIVGKMGVEKWARIPQGLYEELKEMRTESPYVLGAYNAQLRKHHRQGTSLLFAHNVGVEYAPKPFLDWFQERIGDWARATSSAHAYPHVFRKTALKLARSGEDLSREVAEDAKLTAAVMVKHYAPDSDEEFRQASNRMFSRLILGLPEEVARRYGHVVAKQEDDIKERMQKALEREDWALVSVLSAELAKCSHG